MRLSPGPPSPTRPGDVAGLAGAVPGWPWSLFLGVLSVPPPPRPVWSQACPDCTPATCRLLHTVPNSGPGLGWGAGLGVSCAENSALASWVGVWFQNPLWCAFVPSISFTDTFVFACALLCPREGAEAAAR